MGGPGAQACGRAVVGVPDEKRAGMAIRGNKEGYELLVLYQGHPPVHRHYQDDKCVLLSYQPDTLLST